MAEISSLRQKLPANLDQWRAGESGTFEEEQEVWNNLENFFREKGYVLWPCADRAFARAPANICSTSIGYSFAIPNAGPLDSVERLHRFNLGNGSTRVARTLAGQDVFVRPVVLKNEGHRHLSLLRKLSTGRNTFLSNNHCLPMIAEIALEDVVFGIFPKSYGSLDLAFQSWTKNSVGDVLHMLLQALEALCFIHKLGIAHRDAFLDNFLIQWNPQSLLAMKISSSRPRVYLIDFELAIEFPENTPSDECMTIGCPLDNSVCNEDYGRPAPPEMDSGHPYDPFKLDIWQLGDGLRGFKTTIASIDEVLEKFTHENANDRMNATEALDKLESVVHFMAPSSLLIPFPEM